MSEIKVKHTGGFKETKPSVGKGGHPMQKPGMAAAGKHMGEMSWKDKSGAGSSPKR